MTRIRAGRHRRAHLKRPSRSSAVA